MTKNTMGQFMAALRKANGMTQQDVADRLNVSNKAVSRWERDECAPDISLIPAIAEMFGVTCDELLKGERIFPSIDTAKKERKVEKQVSALLQQTLSEFKMLTWASLATTMIGLVCMFGISYVFSKPALGFAVLLLFAVGALFLATVATARTKDMQKSNELFEMAEQEQLKQFQKTFGSYSYFAFFAVFAAFLFSLPTFKSTLLQHTVYQFVGPVPMRFLEYVFWFVWLLVVLSIPLYTLFRKLYVVYLTGNEGLWKYSPLSTRETCTMTRVQLGLMILSGPTFVLASFFKMATYRYQFSLYHGLFIVGCLMILSSIACFVFYFVKHKEQRCNITFIGIRNCCFLPAVFIVATSYRIQYLSPHAISQKGNLLAPVLVVLYCLIVIFISSRIERTVKQRMQKDKLV